MEIRCKIIYSLLDNYNKLLDVGCGDGRHTVVWAKKAKKTIGIDLQKERIKKAKSLENNKIKFMVMNATNIKFKSNSFDCIIAGDILEHFKNPVTFLNEVHRIVKNKGHLILSTPNGNRISLLIRKLIRKYNFPKKVGCMQDGLQYDATDIHFHEYTLKELKKLFGKKFRILCIESTPPLDYFNIDIGRFFTKIFPSLGNIFIIKLEAIK